MNAALVAELSAIDPALIAELAAINPEGTRDDLVVVITTDLRDLLIAALSQPSESLLSHDEVAEGWIEHLGGPCPVSGDTRVDVLFRDRVAVEDAQAEVWCKSAEHPVSFDWWQWEGEEWSDNIIGYKLVVTA